MAELLKGKPVIDKLNEQLKQRAQKLRSLGTAPLLAIIRVGDKGDDIAYERGAAKSCCEAGVDVKHLHFSADVTQDELVDAIHALNGDSYVHGVLLLRPLPPHIDDSTVCRALAPEKDVDGITEYSMGALYTCKKIGFAPCTAEACIDMLNHYGIKTAGKRAVIVGRSFVVGKPLAMMLLERDATVTVCHSKTKNLPEICRDAELLIVAIGRAKMIGRDSLAPGQIVIDVGINFDENGNMCGDADQEAAAEIVRAITPVPGGIGRVTTAVLAKHVVEACEKISQR